MTNLSLGRVFVGLGILAMVTCAIGIINAFSMNRYWQVINNRLWYVFFLEMTGLVLIFAYAYWRNR